MARLVAWLGAGFIAGLIRLLGRRVPKATVPWLVGPIGTDYIGDRPYDELARREHLQVTRRLERGGLLPDIAALDGPEFRAQQLRPEIRDFYQQTAAYRMDVWAATFFPGRIGLWLLVTTLSRKVDQLNFPLDALATAKGIDSEIVLLAEPQGRVRYTGWYRRLVDAGRTLFTGFYLTEQIPQRVNRCVKVVFPMPRGNATVLLRPSVDQHGHLHLNSRGDQFGDAGFYRVQEDGSDALIVWRVRTLHEDFHVYVDPHEPHALRCDHQVRFLGLPVLHLHYRMERKRDAAAAG